MVRFEFREEKSKHFGSIYRPIAEVRLHGEVVVNELFYIDSGADITIIPRTVGELLGLHLEESEIIDLYGIGETALSVVVRNMDMEIGDTKFSARIGWSLTERVPLLLGRLDVFDRFEITFKQREGFTELTPLDAST